MPPVTTAHPTPGPAVTSEHAEPAIPPAEHGRGPIALDVADYARFNGTPALVVRFSADGQQWAWVSGPDCGTDTGGADTRYRVQVR